MGSQSVPKDQLEGGVGKPKLELLEESYYQRLSYVGRSNIYSLSIPNLNTTLTKTKVLVGRSILVALTDGVYILHQNQDSWYQLKESIDTGDWLCSLDAYYLSSNLEEPFYICYGKKVQLGNYSINFAKLQVTNLKTKPNIEVMDRFQLPFEGAPLKITHTRCIDGSLDLLTFVVCSSDNSVVAFQLKRGKKFQFERKELSSVYPELHFLSQLNSNILALVMEVEGNTRRVVVGCQSGQLTVQVIHYHKLTKQTSTSIQAQAQLNFPITSVLIFDNSKVFNFKQGLSVLVTCSINLALIYNSLELDHPQLLPIPNPNDSVLCATLSDLDLDHKSELVLGTYHHQLLSFKPNAQDQLVLMYTRKLPYPIYAILNCDFDGDGLHELIILTTFGLHVLKPKLATARDKIFHILDRIQQLNLLEN